MRGEWIRSFGVFITVKKRYIDREEYNIFGLIVFVHLWLRLQAWMVPCHCNFLQQKQGEITRHMIGGGGGTEI